MLFQENDRETIKYDRILCDLMSRLENKFLLSSHYLLLQKQL